MENIEVPLFVNTQGPGEAWIDWSMNLATIVLDNGLSPVPQQTWINAHLLSNGPSCVWMCVRCVCVCVWEESAFDRILSKIAVIFFTSHAIMPSGLCLLFFFFL